VTEPLVIGDIFRNGARAVPERTAAVLGDRSLSFAEVDELANRTSHALAAHGVGQGDRVATWAGTTLEAVLVFAALAKLGAVFAPLNGLWGVAELADVLRRLRPVLVLVDDDHGARADVLAGSSMLEPEFGFEFLSFRSLEGEAATFGDEDPGVEVRESDPHVVFFTSGSSGRPKGAVLSHRVNVLRSVPAALLEPRGPMVCPYPLFHMGAWTIALQQWQGRDAVVFVSAATAAAVGSAVERHRATRLNAVPAVWRRLLDALAGPEPPDLSSIRFADTGTSTTPPELLGGIASALPDAQVRVFYGSTEAGSVTQLEHADIVRKPGSCGVPGPFTAVRTDEEGQVLVRGPLLFDGYLDDPDATRTALVDRWYATGDLGDLDDEGYLTIVGRLGEVIRTGGEAVVPSEVETILAGHPRVADVAVVGLPDAQWGEVVCAVVVPAPKGPPPELDDLRSTCAGRLASFKHPRRLVLIDEIPRTAATRQVQRRLLLEQLA
jgi:acyl-CoA synthetase (AMP-forming)/AMP-acid ligase II